MRALGAAREGGAWQVHHGRGLVLAPHRLKAGWCAKPIHLKGYGSAYPHAITGPALDGVSMVVAPLETMDPDTGDVRCRFNLGSAYLWRARCAGMLAYEAANQAIDHMVGDVLARPPLTETWQPCRWDIAVDHWGVNWTRADMVRMVTRARSSSENHQGKTDGHLRTYHGDTGVTYYLGQRAGESRYLRIYDKTAESHGTGKAVWLNPLWAQHGWDGDATVWRAEVEHGGRWLRQHGMKTGEDMIGGEGALWEHYCKHNWLAAQRGEAQLRNRSMSPRWRWLSDPQCQEPGRWTWEPRPPSREADMHLLQRQAIGCLSKAIKTYEHEPDPMAAMLEAIGDGIGERLQDAGPLRPLDGEHDPLVMLQATIAKAQACLSK
jgi:hypothetical protein